MRQLTGRTGAACCLLLAFAASTVPWQAGVALGVVGFALCMVAVLDLDDEDFEREAEEDRLDAEEREREALDRLADHAPADAWCWPARTAAA